MAIKNSDAIAQVMIGVSWFNKSGTEREMLNFTSHGIAKLKTLYRRAVHPSYEEQVYDAIVDKGDICYDIGANEGIISRELSNLAGRRGRVYSFEPVPTTYVRLCTMAARKSKAPIHPFPFGLSDTDGTRQMFVPRNPVLNQLASVKRLPIAGQETEIECPFYRLDTVVARYDLPHPDVVKIDVEGAEKFVLDGAETLLNKRPPIMLIEVFAPWEREFNYGPMDVFRPLLARGYQILFACPEGLVAHSISEHQPFPPSFSKGYNILAVPKQSPRDEKISKLLAERQPKIGHMSEPPMLNT
jgi:FkbM family methyltransferase